ncbi:MAG: HK97 gp10 family phage protein [Halopseudomonas sp.]|uniref:HK97 gp10 family phage protein n=1 Tax=Halopseudomonas sp. TaxID=2901191 RepID=UPI003001C158
MSFSGDIGKFARDTQEAHDKITRAATLELFSSVVKATPVDSGRARGNWQTSVGTPIEGEIERLDQGGTAAIAEVQAKTPPGAGQETFMTNNLPYIDSLENGSSQQAPAGMVRRNVARVQRIVNAAIAKVKV